MTLNDWYSFALLIPENASLFPESFCLAFPRKEEHTNRIQAPG